MDGNKTGDDYAYNADGSQNKDLNKGITAITYNYLKLPATLTLSGGTSVSHQYSATGRKLKKTVVTGSTTTTTDYIGSHVYQNGVLVQMAHAEGPIIPQGADYQYQWSLTDHLGNLRVSFVAGAGNKAQVIQSQDYDPWGWQLQGLGLVATTTNKYKYNGKEEQAEIGLYDYGARFYDNTIGRWGVIDPMAEATYHQSPFGYVGNNPVRNTDPTGMLSDEEYRKWAKEADALNDRAERQGVGAYSTLSQGGPGDKNKNQQQSAQPLSVGKLREIAAQEGVTDLFTIGAVFEAAFLEAASDAVVPNDQPSARNKFKPEQFSSTLRPELVRPDGLGPTATRSGRGFTNREENTAFYEVKSGYTSLDANYSRNNPKQLLAMLEVLSRTKAASLGNATLFLITPTGVNINLSQQAASYRVNLINITPTLLPSGQISFNKAEFLYINPSGTLFRPNAELNMGLFNKPVNLKF